jgi:ring-1,2-phenylacetyl-CoA epoxidase subunit PaaD
MVIAAATATDPRVTAIRHALEAVKDPEIPVLTIANLGIVRDVRFDADGLEIVITPTYSGCPAMHMIEAEILETCKWQGYADARVTTVLSPAWTTDWIGEDGRRKLRQYGIAPPEGSSSAKRALFAEQPTVPCPRCASKRTEMISEFGSTACKALYRCTDCREPFDYFKCL